MHLVYDWYWFPWDNLGIGLIIIPISCLLLTNPPVHHTLCTLQYQVWTRVLHFSLLILVHFIAIYNLCIVYAFDSTMVSCIYISLYYSRLCFMHLIQQRWVASTYLCFAVGEGGCLSVISLTKQLPFPNNEMQWPSILCDVMTSLLPLDAIL